MITFTLIIIAFIEVCTDNLRFSSMILDYNTTHNIKVSECTYAADIIITILLFVVLMILKNRDDRRYERSEKCRTVLVTQLVLTIIAICIKLACTLHTQI